MAYSSGDLDLIEKRVPYAGYQTVDVVFAVANTDVVVSHTMRPKAPTDVKFQVIDQTVGGVVFRGTKTPQMNYTVLQATMAGTYRIRLFIEAWLNQ